MNKEVIDKTAKRYFAVSLENCSRIIIDNFGDSEVIDVNVEYHKKVNIL